MKLDIATIFPSFFDTLELSLLGKAQAKGTLEVKVHDLRDYTYDKHRTVDGTPAGGGAGMVMKPEPWGECLDGILAAAGTAVSSTATSSELPPHAATSRAPLIIVPTPAGEVFNQAMASELANEEHLIFACGRYEGIDQRVIDEYSANARVKLVSIGDYVLNGGEVAVLAIIEAVARLVPGVIGNPESLVEESHQNGLLEYPVYTAPAVWRERAIPEVLLSGNHAKINEWRKEQQLERTKRLRPDLL